MRLIPPIQMTLEKALAYITDDELVRLVQDFQRAHRLNIDGVAGVQTQIVLDTVLNPSGSPTLGSAPERTAG